jgi:molybdopterin-guanine dinucleotide biosynthesis protein A
MGPLGGLNAALIYAQECGYRAVLTAGCDTLPIPENLVAHLGSGPAVLKDHFLFGVWPAGCVDALSAHLSMQSDHALRGWIALSRARVVPAPCSFVNLNTQQDLAAYAASLNSSSVGLQ